MPALKWISTDVWDLMPHDGPEHSKVQQRLVYSTVSTEKKCLQYSKVQKRSV